MGVLLGTAILASPSSPVNAASGTFVALSYDAEPRADCVDEGEFRRMVTSQLGYDPFRPAADTRVRISISVADPGFEARIAWTQASGEPVGERAFRSRSTDCHVIAANVAFAIAVQVQLIELGNPPSAAASESDVPDPTARQKQAALESNERPPEPTQRPSISAEVERPPAPASPLPPVQLAIGMGPAVGLAVAPSPTAVGRLFLVARVGRFSAEVAGDAALPVTLREPDGSGVVVSSFGASLAGCGHASFLMACLTGRMTWMRAAGENVDSPSIAWGHFGEVGARLGASKDFGRWALGVHGDGLMMLSRWNVSLNDTVVWKVPRVGGMIAADLSVRFF